jgi:monoamine oxidase
MSHSLFGMLHRRYGTKLSGAELAARANTKVNVLSRWLAMGIVDRDCGRFFPNGVAIVGGGFAGMAAAWTLSQKGVASTVFEARSTYGGRVESDRTLIPGRIVEAGAELIGMDHPMWLELARRFGLGLIVLTGEDQYAGSGLEMPLRLGGKAVTDREKLYKQMAFVLQQISNDAKKVTDPNAPWKASGAAAFDALSVANKLAAFVGMLPKATRHPQLMDALELQFENDNTLPTKEQSYLGLLSLVSGGRLGDDDVGLRGYWEHHEDFRCTEGNDTLAGMMLETSKHILFRPKTRVTEIDISDTRARVTSEDSSFKVVSKDFDYVILTAPPTVWKAIAITPALPSGNEMATGPGIKYLSRVPNRFWIKAGMAPSGLSDELGQTWESTENQAKERDGIGVSVFAGGKWVPKSDGAKHFRTRLPGLYPGFAMRAERYVDWPNTKFIETGYACPKVGQVTTIAKFLSVPHAKRLYFAGEHTSMAYFGYMEGALQSGARAAEALLGRCALVASSEPRRERIGIEQQRPVLDTEVAALPHAGPGSAVLEAAEAAIEADAAPRSSSAWLEAILASAAAPDSAGFEPTLDRDAPSATTLFNVFTQPDHSTHPRHALHRHYAMRYEALATPGEPLASVEPRAGDLLVRVAPGEDWGRIAVVASPGVHAHERLSDLGLRGEGDPLPSAGGYLHVAEPGPRAHAASDRFARRICDAHGVVLPDSLLLRALRTERDEERIESFQESPGDEAAQCKAKWQAFLDKLPTAVREALNKADFDTAVRIAIHHGMRTINDLTNMLFYTNWGGAHGYCKIKPGSRYMGKTEYSTLWRDLRDSHVRPGLAKPSPPLAQQGGIVCTRRENRRANPSPDKPTLDVTGRYEQVVPGHSRATPGFTLRINQAGNHIECLLTMVRLPSPNKAIARLAFRLHGDAQADGSFSLFNRNDALFYGKLWKSGTNLRLAIDSREDTLTVIAPRPTHLGMSLDHLPVRDVLRLHEWYPLTRAQFQHLERGLAPDKIIPYLKHFYDQEGGSRVHQRANRYGSASKFENYIKKVFDDPAYGFYRYGDDDDLGLARFYARTILTLNKWKHTYTRSQLDWIMLMISRVHVDKYNELPWLPDFLGLKPGGDVAAGTTHQYRIKMRLHGGGLFIHGFFGSITVEKITEGGKWKKGHKESYGVRLIGIEAGADISLLDEINGVSEPTSFEWQPPDFPGDISIGKASIGVSAGPAGVEAEAGFLHIHGAGYLPPLEVTFTDVGPDLVPSVDRPKLKGIKASIGPGMFMGSIRPKSFPNIDYTTFEARTDYAVDYKLAEDVHFCLDSALLTEDARQALRIVCANELAGFMSPTSHLTITGHTDRSADESYNLALSALRAENTLQAIRDILATRFAIPDAHVKLSGKGETEAIRDKRPDKERNPKYRRVDVILNARLVLTLNAS